MQKMELMFLCFTIIELYSRIRFIASAIALIKNWLKKGKPDHSDFRNSGFKNG